MCVCRCSEIFHMLLKHAMNFEVCHLSCDLLCMFYAVVVVFFATCTCMGGHEVRYDTQCC